MKLGGPLISADQRMQCSQVRRMRPTNPDDSVRPERAYYLEQVNPPAAQLPQTSRLLLRELNAADEGFLTEILGDPITMTAYEGAFSAAEVNAWLQKQLGNYRRDGHGLWAVVERNSGALIGQCGITWQQMGPQRGLEVGYLFNRSYWHRGFAVEAARSCRDWAFRELGAARVFAQVRDTNLASMNVAIRCGMTVRDRFVKHYRGVAMPHLVFAIERA